MKESARQVMGIDPGSLYTGYGVVVVENHHVRPLYYGTIRMARSMNLPERLGKIYRELVTIIAEAKPEHIAIENVFFAQNPRSALQLGQARGAAIIAAVNAAVPVFEYSPLEVKQAVVGYGRASKEQVLFMIKKLLNIRNDLDSHASDALALAVCHINNFSSKSCGFKR